LRTPDFAGVKFPLPANIIIAGRDAFCVMLLMTQNDGASLNDKQPDCQIARIDVTIAFQPADKDVVPVQIRHPDGNIRDIMRHGIVPEHLRLHPDGVVVPGRLTFREDQAIIARRNRLATAWDVSVRKTEYNHIALKQIAIIGIPVVNFGHFAASSFAISSTTTSMVFTMS
jgi:hypothetical protein